MSFLFCLILNQSSKGYFCPQKWFCNDWCITTYYVIIMYYNYDVTNSNCHSVSSSTHPTHPGSQFFSFNCRKDCCMGQVYSAKIKIIWYIQCILGTTNVVWYVDLEYYTEYSLIINYLQKILLL